MPDPAQPVEQGKRWTISVYACHPDETARTIPNPGCPKCGHYTLNRVEVMACSDATALTTANQQIEELKAELASQEDFQEHVLIEPRVKAARRAMANAEVRAKTAEAKIEELTRERERNQRKVDAYDRARAQVKVEGHARAAYVLRAEAAEAQRDTLREALEEVLSWEPHTEIGLDALHPQHRTAVETARSLLSTPPAKEPE